MNQPMTNSYQNRREFLQSAAAAAAALAAAAQAKADTGEGAPVPPLGTAGGRTQQTAVPAGRIDAYGDPLPADALARLGTARFRAGDQVSSVVLAPDAQTLAVGQGSRQLLG
jgi:hypothetical protein